MLTHTVPINDNTRLGVAASKSGAAGISLTVVEDGLGLASLYLSDRERTLVLLASLIDATRHMGWLSEAQAAEMVKALHRPRRPWWRRWLG